jgi:hypothetical protein
MWTVGLQSSVGLQACTGWWPKRKAKLTLTPAVVLGLQELAEERERLAKQKELEVARLRAMQEKLQDTRAAQDEERAKRYQVRPV